MEGKCSVIKNNPERMNAGVRTDILEKTKKRTR